MSRLRQLLALVLCLAVFSSTSQAWDSFGHMAVAYVAYQKLTAAKQTRAIALIKKNPYYKTQWKKLIPRGTPADQANLMLFMIAATWPDEIKGDKTYTSDGPAGGNLPPPEPAASENVGYSDKNMHKYWHFIDEPFTQDGTSPLPAVPAPNAETRIKTFRTVLAGKKSSKTDGLKSYDLVWLLHIVGDVHQPLHCTTRVGATEHNGDNGGNNVVVSCDKCSKLHTFWDDAAGTSTKFADVIAYGKTLTAADPAQAGIQDESKWVAESFDLAQSQVYMSPIGLGDGPFTLTTAYEDNAKKLAAQRIELAGERLANLINSELK